MDTFSIQIYKGGMLEYIGLNPGLQIQPPTGINFYSKTKIFLKISQYFFLKNLALKKSFCDEFLLFCPETTALVLQSIGHCVLSKYSCEIWRNYITMSHPSTIFQVQTNFENSKKMLFWQKISKSVLKQTV